MASMSIIAKSQTLLTEKEFAAYGRAGAIAEEVLSSIRTVVAFGGQKKEVERFEKKVSVLTSIAINVILHKNNDSRIIKLSMAYKTF